MSGLCEWNSSMVEVEIGDLLLTAFVVNWPVSEKKLAPHFHSMFEFQYCLQNNVILKTSESSHLIREGSYAVIPSGHFHWTEYSGNEFERYSFLFSLSCSNHIAKGLSEYSYYSVVWDHLKEILNKQNPMISECIRNIVALGRSSFQLNEHRMKVYFSMILLEMTKDIQAVYSVAFGNTGIKSPETKEKQRLRGDICEYIVHNYNKDYLLDDIAEELHMSQRNVVRIVKDLFGVPLSSLVLKQRMNSAWGFITETEESLQVIAEKVGYHSYNAFFKAFKRYYGFSPEKLRM